MSESSATCWAIIPARGGSKGIPGKNIKPLCGKPLIGWSIEQALKSERVNRVIVSTDDTAIADVARRSGASVVMRPSHLAGDLSRSEDALLHVLEEESCHGRTLPQTIAFIQCTSPLTLPQDIDGTVSMVLDHGYDTAVTGTPFHYFIWKANERGAFHGVNHDATRRLMRQERTPEFLEIGAVYVMKTPEFMINKFRFFGRIGIYPIPVSRSLEIDEPGDWEMAERMMQPRCVTPVDRPDLKNIADLDVRAVKLVVTDFDGVLTDNRVETFADGRESVVCNRSDGWAAQLLRDAGIQVTCISTERNDVVARRCEKMGLPYRHGADDKIQVLRDFCRMYGVEPRDVLYIGNDTNDADCLREAGWGIVPADAITMVKDLADGITHARGGEGVLREVAAVILQQTRP